MIEFTEHENSIIFTVKVIPRASKTEIVGEYNGALKVKLTAPPVDGAANKELVRLFSKRFGVSKSSIEIVSGETSKTKKVRIFGMKAVKFSELIGDEIG